MGGKRILIEKVRGAEHVNWSYFRGLPCLLQGANSQFSHRVGTKTYQQGMLNWKLYQAKGLGSLFASHFPGPSSVLNK